MNMLSGNFPDELVIEILKGLPTKVIRRFRLVSRSWRDLVRNPDFIVLHMDTQAANYCNNCIFTRRKLYKEVNPPTRKHKYDEVYKLKMYKKVNPFCLFYYCDNDDGDDHNPNYSPPPPPPRSIYRRVDLNLPFLDGVKAKTKDVRVLAYGDGIFWLQYSKWPGTAYLWNHSTGEFKEIPFTCLSTYSLREHATFNIWFGLSFDPRSNDVKVVRIRTNRRYSPEHRGYLGSFFYEVDVLHSSSSSSSSNSWRRIDANPSFPQGPPYRAVDEVSLGGKCYWGTAQQDKPIASFDMADETFEMIDPPPPDHYHSIPQENLHWRMTEMRRSVAIMAMDTKCTSTNRIVHVSVLIMNQNHHRMRSCDDGQGGGASPSYFWSKYLAVDLSSIGDLPAFAIGFCRDTLILLAVDDYLYLHDIVTGETTRLDLELPCEPAPVYACHESLISFN